MGKNTSQEEIFFIISGIPSLKNFTLFYLNFLKTRKKHECMFPVCFARELVLRER